MANEEHENRAVEIGSLIERHVAIKIKYLQELNEAIAVA